MSRLVYKPPKTWSTMRFAHTPIVELNRAVAIAMRDGPQAGLMEHLKGRCHG
jgi:predicted RNA polymerase sigma factor